MVSSLFEGHDLYVAHITSIPLTFVVWFHLSVGQTGEYSH